MEPIRLIPQDLRRQELLLQVSHLLQSLSVCADTVFSRIDQRIKDLDHELEDMDRRAEVARSQVQQLRTFKNRVVRIYSSSRYPSSEEMGITEYKSLTGITTRLVTEKDRPVPVVRGVHIPFSEEVLNDKLQFYPFPVLMSDRGSETDSGSEDRSQPLGPIPFHRLHSVSSLIMFDSSVNPYIGSSLTHVEKTRKKREQEDEAPDVSLNMSGLRSQDQQDDREEDDLLFGLQDSQPLAPTLSDLLPSALPDLDGIAQDMTFDWEDDPVPQTRKQSLAPPVTGQQESASAASAQSVPVPAPRKSSVARTASPPSATPAPPVTASHSGPPAPPPPPPPPDPQPVAEVTQAVSLMDGGRASLLDSIRKAGGKPKKGQVSVKDLKIEKKKIKQAERTAASSSGGDLMSDLMNSLKARRIGISGAQDPAIPSKSMSRTVSLMSDVSTVADPAVRTMSRISSMIPDPPVVAASRTTGITDEDGDSDEWD